MKSLKLVILIFIFASTFVVEMEAQTLVQFPMCPSKRKNRKSAARAYENGPLQGLSYYWDRFKFTGTHRELYFIVIGLFAGLSWTFSPCSGWS